MNAPVRIAVRDRVADALVTRGALTPTTAIPYRPEGRVESWLFARLRRRGAVVEAAPGRFYLHVAAYQAQRDALERRAVPIGLGALALAALMLLLYRG
ncbi:hypothetical protein U1839_14620 [Sphingomonas sp. RT2P30]|uniref:hypothetical protein n=1 Tax=Parasphingomonas halimpatiens TaxID=3096162 RepID=UPI002FCBA713